MDNVILAAETLTGLPLFFAVFGAIATMLGGLAFLAVILVRTGSILQIVKGHTDKFDTIEAVQKDHADTINEHAQRLAVLEDRGGRGPDSTGNHLRLAQ